MAVGNTYIVFGSIVMNISRVVVSVLGANIDVVRWDDVLAKLNSWAVRNESRYVCICNVHSVITSVQDNKFRLVINDADMATPDGAPIAWMLRRLVNLHQMRINGPDLMWRYCEQAQSLNVSMFFYGNTEETLARLKIKLLTAFPNLKIAGMISPPFRTLTPEEDAAFVDQVNSSGAGLLWVSLGCPKQEFWMAAHRDLINAVMVGVGAAFDYHAGTIKRAPLWMQKCGLEWLHRLVSEPRRLWRRYLVTNTLFVLAATKQLARFKLDGMRKKEGH